MKNKAKKPMELYVHIPFCVKKCDYCDFLSGPAGKERQREYFQSLGREIAAVPEFPDREITTVFIGGGTPSVPDPALMGAILDQIRNKFFMAPDAEITIEANPGTLYKEKLQEYRKHGVNRLSLGLQSPQNRELKILGRIHTWEEFLESFFMAREAGFSNINMDFIMGLPGEGVREAQYSMQEACRMRPDNLTVHTLAVKRAARLNQEEERREVLASDSIEEMVELGAQAARQLGMHPYYMYRQKNMAGNFENVGYSTPGKECLYNIEIMEERQSILAMGAGAVSKFYEPEKNRVERLPNVKNVEEYITRLDEMLERKRRRFAT